MGIANTTSAAAIIAAQTGRPPADVTGIGTGIDHGRWRRKVDVVERALARATCRPDDPLGTLSEVGGFEIGALAGAMLAGAACGVPVVIDGVIVGAAAVLAVALCPEVRSYLVASHRSAEPGHRVVLELLELEPLMDLGLRLGEGSGAAIALHTIRLACALPRQMATFAEARVSEKGDLSPRAAHPT
jgi:nicotinate-nucleotide--dimethylbenzimidazole phosphoribosyltransferase